MPYDWVKGDPVFMQIVQFIYTSQLKRWRYANQLTNSLKSFLYKGLWELKTQRFYYTLYRLQISNYQMVYRSYMSMFYTILYILLGLVFIMRKEL